MSFHLIKEVRDIGRFNEILGVLFEEGFDFLLAKIQLKHYIPLTKRLKSRLKKNKELKPEVMLRHTLERLGPTFIKFGQVLSIRPDLVPKEYSNELEKLQDRVPSFPYSEVKKIIEKEFGKSINHVFLHFEEKPVASASISQVHRAVLKTGEEVAVKVQRPEVNHLMETDIEIMYYFAKLLEKYFEKMKKYSPVRIVNEFKEWTERELDFRVEARNAKRFYENFKGSKTVHIPKVYENLTTEKLITMEFVNGVELHDIEEIKKRKLNFNIIMRNGFNALMTQVFVHGIFHADPHPGNIIVMRDNSLTFIDFGIVGYFDEKLKNKCIDLIYGIVEQDEELIMDVLLSMGMVSDEINYEQLKSDIGFIISPLQHSSMKEIKLSKMLEEILEIALKHKLKVPAAFVLFGKTVITLEGIAIEYDPNFKLIETARPFIEKVIAKRKNPLYIFKNLMHNMNRYKRFAEDLPEKVELALEKIQRGSIKVDIEDTNLKKLVKEIDISSNRITYGLLITSLLITSALLIQVHKGPTIFGIPFLSFFSFFLAATLAFILFISIVREKIRNW